MAPIFSILLPVTRPPIFLPFAIESVLAQTISEFELLVVCDGAPPETIKCAENFAARDSRVKVFAFPKGEGSGETHRHTALESARGTYVAHIEDDDLWFPTHLQELKTLLATVDFGSLIHVWLKEDRSIEALSCNLAEPRHRQRFVNEMFNRFGLTVCGYRLDAYRRLPIGWAPGPPGFWPDLWMWRATGSTGYAIPSAEQRSLRQLGARSSMRNWGYARKSMGLPHYWRRHVQRLSLRPKARRSSVCERISRGCGFSSTEPMSPCKNSSNRLTACWLGSERNRSKRLGYAPGERAFSNASG